jgi:hypothetical protein
VCAELALLGEALEHDRGRRQRDDQTECGRRRGREAEREVRDRAAEDGRGCDLEAAQAEDRAPQAPELRGLELEADQEQHHHDAELGEVQHVLALLAADEREAERSDRDPGDQVAEHRSEAAALRDRDRDHGRCEIHERLEPEVTHVEPRRATGKVGGRRAG